MSATHITASERKTINQLLSAAPVLSGNDRSFTITKGLALLTTLLDAAGFTLEMVTGDTLLGQSGNALFRFTRIATGTEIQNSGISFSWHHEYCRDNALQIESTELVAYAS